MANVLRIAVVDPNDASRDSLKAVLLGLDSVWLEAECSRYEFFTDVIEQTKPDIGLVAMDSDPEKATKLVAEVAAKAPQCTLFVTSSSTDGRLILESMRAGAKEFLTEPLKEEDLISAIKRVKRHGGEREVRRRARLPGDCRGWCDRWRGIVERGRESGVCVGV